MKKKCLKYSLITVAIILLVVGVPILINELYKVDGGYITKWGASDVLEFYGTILASLGGIFGVFITVWCSQKQYREDARIRIMPYFTINQCNNATLNYLFVNSSEHYKKQSDKICRLISYSDGKITSNKRYLSNDQVMNILRNGDRLHEVDGKVTHEQKRYYFTIFKIKNEDFAPAIKVQVGLFEESETFEHIVKGGHFIPLQAISKGGCFYLGFYFNLTKIMYKKFNLYLVYSDVSKRRYYQKVELKFVVEGDKIFLEIKDTGGNDLLPHFKEGKENG